MRLNKFFFVCLVVIQILITPALVKSNQILIEEGINYREISVETGIDFTLRLAGSGWYLNRYDRTNLSFKLRSVEPDYTEFIIRPLHNRDSYLFFSYMENDIYILVRITHSIPAGEKDEIAAESRKGGFANIGELIDNMDEAQVDTGHEKIKKPLEIQKENIITKLKTPLEKEGPFQDKGESDRFEPEVKTKTGDLSTEQGEKAKKKATSEDKEIFYSTKDNKIVKVPYKSEDDSYHKGVRFFKRGMLSEALKSFLDYLSQCERCVYENDAHYRSANLYLKIGKDKDAIKHLDKLIVIGSQKHKKEAYLIKAGIDFNAGKIQDALDGYRNVLKYDAGNKEVSKKIGDIYYQLEEYENALSAYKKGIKEGIESDEVYFKVAIIYDSPGKSRNLEKAYKYYKMIVDRYVYSEHYIYAKKRVNFLDKNFFKYK